MAKESDIEFISIPGVDCVVNPFRAVKLSSPVAGVIDVLNVARSQKVIKGQIVAQLKTKVELANVELARFRANIQSEIKLEQVNLRFDKLRKKRIDTLRKQEMVSMQNIDEAKREENLSRWKLEQARELVDVRKLELQRAEEQLHQKTIRAPFDGYVLDTYKDSGEYVEDQPILLLAQLDPLLVEAIVPMDYFKDVSPGMLAEVIPEVLSGTKLKAKVIVVDRMGDTASNTFGVRLILDNPDNQIPAGLKCILKFIKPVKGANEPLTNELKDSPLTSLNNENIRYKIETLGTTDKEKIKKETEDNIETVLDSAVNGSTKDAATSLDSKETISEVVYGYHVIIPQGETEQQTNVLISRLHAAGVDDFLVMNHGSFKGKIQLGFFKRRDLAIKLKLALHKHGLAAEISVRRN